MSQEPQVLRTIEWRSVFPFTQLFQSFRVAIHPAKLVLALLAILLVYCCGRTLDAIWRDKHLAVAGEVSAYDVRTSGDSYDTRMKERRDELTASRKAIAQTLRDEALQVDSQRPLAPAAELSVRDLRKLLAERRDREIGKVKAAFDASPKADVDRQRLDTAIRDAYASAGQTHALIEATLPRGIFASFLAYEIQQVDLIAIGVLEWNWTGESGVLHSLRRFVFVAPGWALSQHPLYAIMMTLAGLFVWSVFGGAIARIAAVHVARDEKISVRQALRFSIGKLMSFFMAPLMPILLITGIALLLAALGWISELRFVGGLASAAVGLLFVVLIGVGVLVACAVVGMVCGAGLMYPTIAVEGSDAFDAVSRSFSYVFARPWKIAIYTFIGIIYAALTYVFLRFMVYLTLSLLHTFMTLWTGDVAPDGTASLANAWRGPSGLFNLFEPLDTFNLTLGESAAAWAITFWAYLFIGLLAAYLLSYFVSVNTIAYYLLRYDVDAAEIDDVYLEPTEEDFEDAPIDTPVTQTVSVETASESAKPSAKDADLPTPPPAGA